MQPDERIKVIKRVAEQLAATDDWGEIDLVLEQFGFRISDHWQGDMRSYIIEFIKDGSDGRLAAIDRYFMGDPQPRDEPWENEGFRLFLTHVATQKQEAHSLKSCLRCYGVEAFVAHDDIQPGKGWQLVIESALHSCDALAGLLHKGFRKSDWCDQEIGIALGRGKVVVPIHFDLLPYGFFGSVQAVSNAADQEPETLARNLVLVLLKDKRTGGKLTQAIADQLARATSYEQANRLSRMLANEAPLLSRHQVKQLRKAQKTNSQLQGAWDFNGYLSSIEAKIDIAEGVVSREDSDEPF